MNTAIITFPSTRRQRLESMTPRELGKLFGIPQWRSLLSEELHLVPGIWPLLTIFSGLFITTRGCSSDLQDFVRKETGACGGIYFDGNPPLVDQDSIRTVVPLDLELDDTHDFPGVVVTSFWFERSVTEESIVGSVDHFLFAPMKKFPIEGFEDLYVSTNGLDTMEHTHVGRAVQLLGGQFHKDLEEGVTNLLITDRPSGPKFEHMARNRLPVVRMNWLQRSIAEGIRLPFDNYLVVPTGHSVSQGSGDYDDPSRQGAPVVSTQSGLPSVLPLDGLNICIPNRVVGDLDEMRVLARSLGATASLSCYSFMSSLTHLIHHGNRSPDVMEDVRAAKVAGVHVVAPSWLYKSGETGLRQSEHEHPAIYGADTFVYKDLRQSSTPPSAPPVQRSEQDVQDHSNLMRVWQPAPHIPLPQDQLCRTRPRALYPSEDSQGTSADASKGSGFSVPSVDDNYRASQDDEARASKDVVLWFDSDERDRKRAFMADLGHKNSASLFAHPTDKPIIERNNDPDPGNQLHQVKYFLLSGIHSDHREKCKETIQALGGVVLEDETLDPEEWQKRCTHLLTDGDNPRKTVKVEIARARRAKILAKSYIFACEKAGKYVDEEPHRVYFKGR